MSVSATDLEQILESETGLTWGTITDKPDLKRFTAISFEVRVEYYSGRDHWRFSFDDAASGHETALGPIDTDSIYTEFRPFVRDAYDEVA